jgi:hypothetical protein
MALWAPVDTAPPATLLGPAAAAVAAVASLPSTPAAPAASLVAPDAYTKMSGCAGGREGCIHCKGDKGQAWQTLAVHWPKPRGDHGNATVNTQSTTGASFDALQLTEQNDRQVACMLTAARGSSFNPTCRVATTNSASVALNSTGAVPHGPCCCSPTSGSWAWCHLPLHRLRQACGHGRRYASHDIGCCSACHERLLQERLQLLPQALPGHLPLIPGQLLWLCSIAVGLHA